MESPTFSPDGGGGKLVPCMVVLGLAAVAVPLNAQICNTTPSNSNPPCVLTAGYAGSPAYGSTLDPRFNARQNINPWETTFTVSGVGSLTTRGTLFEVDDQSTQLPPLATSNPIMAQPLYVKGITISDTTYNMVIAATVNSTLFAWTESGTLLWSRQGIGGAYGTNALYSDDCGSLGTPVPRFDVLQFEGVLSTPVIDASESQYSKPVMFVTSYCETGGDVLEWWIHEIDLTTGLDAVSPHHIGGTGDFASINESRQQQRSALLEITNSYNTTTPNLIYALFGTGVQENIVSEDYTGWVAMYTSTSSGLVAQHAYSDEPGGNSGSSGCAGGGMTMGSPSLYNGQCTTNSGNTGSPGCDCLVYAQCPVAGDSCNYSTGYCTTHTLQACTASPYQFAPNWGGHGGGCWMSGNGPAVTVANAIGGDDSVHVFFGCGNGGFEAFNGATPDSHNDNGQSIMDFRMTSSGFNQGMAFQTFTPYSPAFGVGPQSPSDSVCNCTGNPPTGCQPCTTTLQESNVYDHDMAVGGVALFNDLAGNPRLVSPDKAGYSYLFYQGQLCGSSYTDTGCVAFAAGDVGSWTFWRIE
jgi:hypothetical protein